jgi:exosortase/archaeosortase family protein
MVEIWNRSETFAHAWVVPPISAWLVWRSGRSCCDGAAPGALWLLALLPLGLLWLLGDLAAANAPLQFALLGMGVVLVPALLGTAVAGRMAFPLGFLFFAVPFGDFLTPWLMERPTSPSSRCARHPGVPRRPAVHHPVGLLVRRAGLQRHPLPDGLGHGGHAVRLPELPLRSKRWAFVGVAIVTPLVANWLRAYIIVMLGHLSGNKLAVGVDHMIYGWVFFGIIMLAMFMIGARWADPDPEPTSAAPPGRARCPRSAGRGRDRWPPALVLLALPPACARRPSARAPMASRSSRRRRCRAGPGWRSR